MRRYIPLLGLVTVGTTAMAKSPNILVILADDMSYRDLSCYGQSRYQTPNIDALCSSAVRFTQAYAAAPESAPSRCSLLTGLHTGHSSVRINSSARGQDNLLDSDITIAEVLRGAGYNTAFIGKWGVGIQGTEGVPYKQGFNYAFGFYDQTEAHTYIPDYMFENERRVDYPENSGFEMARRYDYKGNKAQNSYDESGRLRIDELKDPYGYTYSENEFQRVAMEFLDKHLDNNSKDPFFLYYATQLPHGPVIVDDIGKLAEPKEVNQLSREWGAMVVKLDRFVGELVAYLKQRGEYDNTLIMFASDNGYSMCGYTERGNGPEWADDEWLRNKGEFRGGKFTTLEGGVRIPMFISYPEKFAPKVVSTPVWLPDIFPTFAQIGGAKAPQSDGVSLVDMLSRGNDQRLYDRPLYFSRGAEQSVRMGAYSIYRPNIRAKSQLYLIEEDVTQSRNLAHLYPDVVARAERIMQESLTPHEWYWTPDESREEYQKKIDRAKQSGNILPVYRPNGIEYFPWERKNK